MTIAPDDKDWTWVLTQPCLECGFEADTVPREAFGDLVAGGVQDWLDALRDPSAASRLDATRWSTLEYACHVRDVHRIFAGRVHQLLTDDNPTFANWDQDEAAIEGDYAGQNPQSVGADLASAAEAMADLIDGIDDNQWERAGQRSNGSVFTVDSLIRYYLHDVIHHEWDLA